MVSMQITFPQLHCCDHLIFSQRMIIFLGINDQSRYEKVSDYYPMDFCLSATLKGPACHLKWS